ncbi:MAG TPA: hypothetical protein VF255_06740 [Solirubrobacterales bacterium]
MSLPPGYLLPEGKTMQDVLCMDAELLASEGLDPAWPGFDAKPEESDKGS